MQARSPRWEADTATMAGGDFRDVPAHQVTGLGVPDRAISALCAIATVAVEWPFPDRGRHAGQLPGFAARCGSALSGG
jgi:hypothetical protein